MPKVEPEVLTAKNNLCPDCSGQLMRRNKISDGADARCEYCHSLFYIVVASSNVHKLHRAGPKSPRHDELRFRVEEIKRDPTPN